MIKKRWVVSSLLFIYLTHKCLKVMLPGSNSIKSKPPYLKKYDVARSKNIYNLLIMHIFLQKSVFQIFKTTKTEVINKRKKHFAPAIRTKICIHNYY